MNYRNFNLTKFVKAAGWAAKIDPEGLNKNVSTLLNKNKNLLSNITSNEDASVYKISDELALVQTLDFITPVVDDPYIFGQIAAANSLSDIFAMGANAINALNIIGFDSRNFADKILTEILEGGKSKLVECGAQLVGGHSIETPEMYYGLSVTGVVHPKKFWSNNSAKVGDVLILTKPLGTGILSTAIKANMLEFKDIKEVASIMATLNFYALKALKEIRVNACTDVTGFGLLGHISEMLNENISIKLYLEKVPILKSAQHALSIGLIPEGAYKNSQYINKFTNKNFDIIYCDPQTSGGLLIAVGQKDASNVVRNLKSEGYEYTSIVGEVISRDSYRILI